MSNKQFLKEHALQRSLPTKEANAFEKLLKIANTSFVLLHTKTKGIKVGKLQYWDFSVHCPTRNFADAYAHVGLLWGTYESNS
jgi:hypothetical protein